MTSYYKIFHSDPENYSFTALGGFRKKQQSGDKYLLLVVHLDQLFSKVKYTHTMTTDHTAMAQMGNCTVEKD